MVNGDDEYNAALEKRVEAYLEMHESVLVAALNHHYKSRAGFVQAKLFDLRALTTALTRSNLDVSEIFNEKGSIPFLHPFRLNGSKIIFAEDDS